MVIVRRWGGHIGRRTVSAVLGLGVVACVALLPPAVPASAAVACGAGTVTVTRVSGPVLYLQSSTSPALDSAYAMYKISNTGGTALPDVWVQIGTFAGPKIGLAGSETGRAHLGMLSAGATMNAAFYLSASGEDLSAESHAVTVYTTRPDLGVALCQAPFTMTAEEDIAASANKVTSVSSSSTPRLGGKLTITVVGDTGTIGSAGRFTATPASYATWPANAYRLTGSKITMSGGNSGVFNDTLYFSGLNSSATDYTAEFTFAVVGTTATTTAVSPMTHISSGTQVKHTTTSSFGTLPAIAAVVNNTTLALSGSPAALTSAGGTVTYTLTVGNTGSGATTLDDLTVTLPAGTTYVPGSATFGGTTTADPDITGGIATFLAGLTVAATGSSDLTLQVSVPGTAGTYTATAVGHVGAVTVDTTLGTADSQPATAGITVAGPPPTVTAVSPATGPAAGGTTVTITGTRFTGATAVRFGTQPAATYTVVNATTITANTPAGSGAVDLTVTTTDGTSATHAQDIYTYAAPPVAAPTPGNVTSTGVGTAAQTVTIVIPAGGAATLLAGGVPTAGPVVVLGQGSYLLSGTTITFTPVAGYAGVATPVTYQVTDQYLQTGTATYTPTVAAVAPPPPAPRNGTSTGVGTSAQTATIVIPAGGTATLLVGGVPTGGPVVVVGQGSYALSGTTITFTPIAGYAGIPTPVTYQVTDQYQQTGTATYSPTVTAPPGPSPAALTSTGVGTTAQTVTVTIPTGGTATLLISGVPAGVVTVAMGTYRIDGPTITFAPGHGFTGTATPVTYQVTDQYQQTGTGTYQPSVTAPAGPVAADLTSIGEGVAEQIVIVAAPEAGTVRLVGADTPLTTRTIAGKGTYTVVTTGLMFVPNLGFTGSVTTSYRVTDAYGLSAVATYTATVTVPPPPAAPDRATRGIGTTPQTTVLLVPAGGTIALLTLDGNPVTTLSTTGKGTYRLKLLSTARSATVAIARAGSTPALFVLADAVSGTATVTFVAVTGYTGTSPPVTYRITDAYGQSATATYTPTVTRPLLAPPPPKTSSGRQTDSQHVTLPVPLGGSVALLNSDGDPVTTLTVPGQGTYTLNPTTGLLTFIPTAGFTGVPDPITYRITDAYGQNATATYTPNVIAGAALPTTGQPLAALMATGILLLLAGIGARVAAHTRPATHLGAQNRIWRLLPRREGRHRRAE